MSTDYQSVNDLNMGAAAAERKTESVSAWEDEVLYFLLVDRFSDGNEDMSGGHRSNGNTPLFTDKDRDNAIQTPEDAEHWRQAGRQWVGGTLKGVQSKLNYLKGMGVTALWISPILKQSPTPPGQPANYHGYATQNFLQIDPHLGTAEDLRELVQAAHTYGIKIILDIVLNHAGNVFAYKQDGPWNGRVRDVAGWRDGNGHIVPYTAENADSLWPDGAVWPKELHAPDTFTRKGYIANWDNSPEYIEGDFCELKDITHGHGPTDNYIPSPALLAQTRAYCWWLAYADLDGFRIDTVKHMDIGATRYFASMVHEYAQAVGKDRFLLIGEITGPRTQAIDTMELTGLDAALGIADVQYQIEATAKGWGDPSGFFDLFRNSALLGKESHTWLRNTVVTSYDDHDQVRKGVNKGRFCADEDGPKLALTALALTTLTLGIPCIYYGSEQGLDGSGNGDYSDSYIREAMFGGEFGAFRSRGRHVFNPEHPLYKELAAMLEVRRLEPALRRGRQYLRQISGDGKSFGYPTSFGGAKLNTIVAWSRILADKEVLCAINTDPDNAQTAWVVIDSDLHHPEESLTRVYASPGEAEPAQFVQVTELNGLAVNITLPPGGVVVYTSKTS